jgi:arylsulfatase A-like enzyme
MKSLTRQHPIVSGALHGIRIWAVYAIAETACVSVLPWMLPLSHGYLPVSRTLTAILLAAYPLVGLIAGAVAGWLVSLVHKAPADGVCRAAALLTLLIPLAVNFSLFYSYAPARWLSIALASAATIALFSGAARSRLGVLLNPWTAVLLILGPPWLSWEVGDAYSASSQRIFIWGYVAAVLLVSWAAGRVTRRGRDFDTRPGLAVARLGIIAVTVFGLTFLFDQKPLITPSFLAGGPPRGTGPNIILIVLDTVRADHLSIYGYPQPTTPQLGGFAADATLYTQAIAASDMTLATHASIFTGLYASRHGAHLVVDHNWGLPLPADIPTLAEALGGHGYTTMAAIANYGYLSQPFGLARGFQYYDARAAVPFLGQARSYLLRARARNVLRRLVPLAESERVTRTAEEINQAGLDLIDRTRQRGNRFFLFLNYMDAHWPYLPPPPYDTRFPGRGSPITSEQFSTAEIGVLNGSRPLQERVKRHLISQYDGAISYLDDQLGRLFTELKRRGIYDESLIIVTADHGEAFGDRNLMEHGTSTYQDQVHVPLLVKYPASRRRAVISTPVSSVDLMPTILAAAAIPIPKAVEGQNLVNVAEGDPRVVIAETFPNAHFVELAPRFRRVERAVVSGSRKLIVSTAGQRELYDLATDPGETANLYPSDAGARQLEARMSLWLKTAVRMPKGAGAVDRQALERLKSLGYVQ